MLASVKTQKSAIVSQYKSLKTKHKKLVQTIAKRGVKGKPASSKKIKVAQEMKKKLDRLKTKFSKSKKKDESCYQKKSKGEN
jgi:fructose-1,6-bisphosphatase